ncbi:hypothetical protein CPB85DRAFT_1212617 [Mucidula mucida]|nr:hypothetical protein CPB85DRAFT_1212617 [Mucidula mucida]
MLTTVSLLSLLSLFSTNLLVEARPCLASDINWNLLAFGFDGKDYNAGTIDSWSSGSASEITADGRPAFDGENTTCYLSQFFNAVYVVNGDAANPSDIYIYDAANKAWSKQTTTTGSFDISSATMILDHDTNLFYAVAKSEMWALDMGSLATANSTALEWVDVSAVGFSNLPSNYDPTIAIAQNHIHFMGVQAGSADIFVIHFSYFQPEVQSYGAEFPATHGQAPSFFMDSGVQQEFAYIPDGGSNVYVVNVETNSTKTLAGPSSQASDASYYATVNALLQLSSDGAVTYIPYDASSSDASSASWSSVANLASVATVSSSSSSVSSSGTKTAKGSVSTNGSSSGDSDNGVREQSVVMGGLFMSLLFGTFGMLLF